MKGLILPAAILGLTMYAPARAGAVACAGLGSLTLPHTTMTMTQTVAVGRPPQPVRVEAVAMPWATCRRSVA